MADANGAPASPQKSPQKKAASPAKPPKEFKAGERSSSRVRKEVKTFEPEGKKETEGIKIPQGKGQKLGDIHNVAFRLDEHKGDDDVLYHMHFLMYGRNAKGIKRKANIREFCGFAVPDEKEKEEAEFQRVSDKVARWPLPLLKDLLKIFDLERSGTKDELVKRAVTWLFNPHPSDKPDLKPKPKTKRSRSKSKTPKKGSKKRKASDASGDSGSESDEEEVQKSPKKKAKASPKKSAPKSSPKKKTPAKKPKKEESDSDEDEPLVPKEKKVTLSAIKENITAILKASDLQDITPKQVRMTLQEKFACDLMEHKAYIKECCQEYIANH